MENQQIKVLAVWVQSGRSEQIECTKCCNELFIHLSIQKLNERLMCQGQLMTSHSNWLWMSREVLETTNPLNLNGMHFNRIIIHGLTWIDHFKYLTYTTMSVVIHLTEIRSPPPSTSGGRHFSGHLLAMNYQKLQDMIITWRNALWSHPVWGSIDRKVKQI